MHGLIDAQVHAAELARKQLDTLQRQAAQLRTEKSAAEWAVKNQRGRGIVTSSSACRTRHKNTTQSVGKLTLAPKQQRGGIGSAKVPAVAPASRSTLEEMQHDRQEQVGGVVGIIVDAMGKSSRDSESSTISAASDSGDANLRVRFHIIRNARI